MRYNRVMVFRGAQERRREKAMAKLYSFRDHPDHEAQLKGWADKWIANAMSTKAMDDHERER